MVAANFRAGRFELDLLVARGSELRAVEVKARAPGAWCGADTALGFHQRLRLQTALRVYLDRVPWPGRVSFQRVSWSGWRWRFHPPERWDWPSSRFRGFRFPGGRRAGSLAMRPWPGILL